MKKNESKFRLLSILNILKEESDENHPLTTQQIIQKLEKDYEIPAHRTTVGNDIEILTLFGYDICKVESTSNKYYMASREFETDEIKMIMDAVSTSKFINESASKDLVDKILGTLCSASSRDSMKRNLIVEGRTDSVDSELFKINDSINDAINGNKKISFRYYRYDGNKNLSFKNDGEPYILSPYSLVWSGEFYYVVGYSDKHNTIVSFRVDRIAEVPKILKETIVAPPADFNLEDLIKSSFSMYNSAKQDVVLQCEQDAMDSIIERLGLDIDTTPVSGGKFRIKTKVAVSSLFFGWIFGFGGKVEIIAPADVKRKYKEMVVDAASPYFVGGGLTAFLDNNINSYDTHKSSHSYYFAYYQ